MSGTDAPRPGSLLGLSTDLRRMIFTYVFPNRRTVEVGRTARFYEADAAVQDDNPRPGISLLYVCRQISEECLDILYGWNAFEVRLHDSGEETLARFAPASRNRIKYLAFVARPTGKSFWRTSPNLPLWRPIIASAEVLQFCFHDGISVLPPGPPHRPVQRRVFLRWCKWVCPYLDIFSQYVRPNVEIDVIEVNGPWNREMFDSYFPPSMRIRSDYTQRLRGGTPWWKSRVRRGG